ncbi:hypothetical protein EDL79_04100 [Ehrlichia ruminantium]|nr:hypothetical protein EDL79_04100 [Ehrlichia ruminantium]
MSVIQSILARIIGNITTSSSVNTTSESSENNSTMVNSTTSTLLVSAFTSFVNTTITNLLGFNTTGVNSTDIPLNASLPSLEYDSTDRNSTTTDSGMKIFAYVAVTGVSLAIFVYLMYMLYSNKEYSLCSKIFKNCCYEDDNGNDRDDIESGYAGSISRRRNRPRIHIFNNFIEILHSRMRRQLELIFPEELGDEGFSEGNASTCDSTLSDMGDDYISNLIIVGPINDNGNSDSSSRRSSTSDSTRSGNSCDTEALSFASLRYSSESETEDDVNNGTSTNGTVFMSNNEYTVVDETTGGGSGEVENVNTSGMSGIVSSNMNHQGFFDDIQSSGEVLETGNIPLMLLDVTITRTSETGTVFYETRM